MSILKSLRLSSLALSVDPLSVGLDQFICAGTGYIENEIFTEVKQHAVHQDTSEEIQRLQLLERCRKRAADDQPTRALRRIFDTETQSSGSADIGGPLRTACTAPADGGTSSQCSWSCRRWLSRRSYFRVSLTTRATAFSTRCMQLVCGGLGWRGDSGVAE